MGVKGPKKLSMMMGGERRAIVRPCRCAAGKNVKIIVNESSKYLGKCLPDLEFLARLF